MPNTSRGGGISRKITSTQDRQRLKELVEDLEVPEGMGVILRTAGCRAHQGRDQARPSNISCGYGKPCARRR